jgi:pilus assembly protein CpaB
MRGKSLALLMLALGCGLVASIGITQVISKPEAAPAETDPVLVAIKDIPLGEAVNADNVKREQWPKDKVPSGVLGKLEEVDGHRSRTRIYAGEPILAVKLFGKGASDLGASPQIPKGMRSVAVKVDSVSANSGLIMPGDRVDVLVHLQPNPTAGITEPIVRTVLQFIKVFAVNDVLNVEGLDHEKSIAAKTISLLVTPEQAQKVTMATEMGQIRLVLRSPEDENTGADVPTFSSRELLTGKKEPVALRDVSGEPAGNGGFLDFLKQNLNKSESAVHPSNDRPLDTFRMRLFLGAAVEDVVLKKYVDSQETAGGSGTWTTDEAKSSDSGAATQTAKPQSPNSAQQSKPKAGPPPENGSPPPGAKSSLPISGGARG